MFTRNDVHAGQVLQINCMQRTYKIITSIFAFNSIRLLNNLPVLYKEYVGQ